MATAKTRPAQRLLAPATPPAGTAEAARVAATPVHLLYSHASGAFMYARFPCQLWIATWTRHWRALPPPATTCGRRLRPPTAAARPTMSGAWRLRSVYNSKPPPPVAAWLTTERLLFGSSAAPLILTAWRFAAFTPCPQPAAAQPPPPAANARTGNARDY